MATPIPDNRAELSLAEIVHATGGRSHGLAASQRFVGVSTDSRTAPAGGLFVALVGASQDGHRFVDAARALGSTPLVAAGAGIEGPRIEVADTLLALGQLARAFVERSRREHGPRPVLAIGGAAGKTTTKTLAAAAVGALCGETLATAGNLNNRIGVPMTLLTLEPRHRAVVLECGTSEKGEIAALGAIARPDVALVTNVGVEHSAGLGSIEEIADEEAELLLAARYAAVTSAEEPLLLARLERATAPHHFTFGLAREADLRLLERVTIGSKTRLRFRLQERLSGRAAASEVQVTTPLLGAAAALNVAAAFAGALALLARPATDEELAATADALGGVEAVPGRLYPRTVGEYFVLDDTYNSNPKSVPPALAAAREVAELRGVRLVVALGDMLELGSRAGQEHQEMVALAVESCAALLVFVGEECGRALHQASLTTPFRWYPDATAAAAGFAALLEPGDVVLVKGSRGIRMERLIEALT